MANDFQAELAYLAVGGYYDYQRVRLGHMNRLRDLIRKKNEGIPFDKKEDKQEVKKYLAKYKDEKLEEILHQMVQEKKLGDDELKHVYKLQDIAKQASNIEENYKAIMLSWISTQPVYMGFLSKIKGLGPVLSSGLLATFDPRAAKHVSSLWKYAGLHVNEDGKAPKLKRGEKPGFNPAARVLIWKVSDSFIKQRTPKYRKIYDEEKVLQQKKHGDGKDHKCKAPKMHIDLRARRKMMKQFLADLWLKWRESLNLPVDEPYSARFHPETQ